MTKLKTVREKAEEALEFLKFEAKQLHIDEIADVVLNKKDFFVCSGSSGPKVHHYGEHGLILHTKEVVELCQANNKLLGMPINPSDLFLAALFHDIGKIYDYAFYTHGIDSFGKEIGTWDITEHKKRIHHISRSGIIWSKAAEKFGYNEEEVLHAILAHHGQRGWGSPIEPQTQLAWMLHLCDGISARMADNGDYK